MYKVRFSDSGAKSQRCKSPQVYSRLAAGLWPYFLLKNTRFSRVSQILVRRGLPPRSSILELKIIPRNRRDSELDPAIEMPKSKSGFYAVKRGASVGVYSSWEECERNVKGQ
jgi:hypothetical protein